jgi:molybdate transport system substrate-binding protein
MKERIRQDGFLWIVALLTLVPGLSSCGSGSIFLNPLEFSDSTSTNGLTVAAAADLQFAFTEIAALFEEDTNTKVTLVFGSTGQLGQQIENGAPYDLFAAADRKVIGRLVELGLIEADSVELYARGRIVLAVNRQTGIAAADLKELPGLPVRSIAIANPDHAPYGAAAKQALAATGVWDDLQDRLVFGENVRQTLQFVQTGDAEVGIVALSVANVPEISWTFIDEQYHDPLDQALGVVVGSPHAGMARQFAQFINGDEGRPVMRKYGFTLPDETPAEPGSEP